MRYPMLPLPSKLWLQMKELQLIHRRGNKEIEV
jgi:hypothetical protein